MTFNEGSVKNYTEDQAIKFETDQCSKSLKMSKVFNNQKSLIIVSIDCNIQNIQDFLKGKVEVRHFKHAPLGLGRKKSIDLAHRTHIELIHQVNNSFGKIAGQFSKLWSVTRIQNDALRKTIGRIDNQEKQIQNLIESMRKSQKAIDILQRYQALHISMLYSLQTYQTAMQTRLLKTTMSILNTLQLINTQTGKIISGLQQLNRGELPADLISPRKLQKTLENIDKQLMMNNLPFQIPISSLKYYYGTKLIGFAHENSLSIMMRFPLTYDGGIFKLYKINTIKLPLPVKAMKDGVQKYAKLPGYPDYFAISYDEEYYMEMTHTELINCKGLDEYPKVCNPVKIMESVRDKPSCGLTIYKGDAAMMKAY